jgi:antimicrobial peptide system SdpA family protein
MFRLEESVTSRTTGRRTVGALAVLWLVVALYSVHAVLPTNALTLPFERSLEPAVNDLAPQGWAFFTKSPRDPLVTAYRFRADGTPYRVPEITASDHRNLFGISRRGRAIGTEMALLLPEVPDDRWVQCRRPDPACLSSTGRHPPYPVRSPVPGPQLCGEVVLALESVVPYAYRRLVPTPVVVDRAVRLVVECRP